LTATASNNWMFTGWSDGNTNNPRVVTITAGGAAYTANFAPAATLVVQPNLVAAGTASGSGIFATGSLRPIAARANFGYRFLNWSDGGTNASRTITLLGNTNLTANFLSASASVLLQAGNGGLAGLWGLGTNYLPVTWTHVAGTPAAGWVLRSYNQNRILVQQGTGGAVNLWEMGTNGTVRKVWPVSGALPGWIVRDLDGNRILLQAGDGGAVGLWTLTTNNTPATWSVIANATPSLIVRSIYGRRILLQFGTTSLFGFWTLDASNNIIAWTPFNTSLPTGWILRSMSADRVLIQAGDGGLGGLWELNAAGQPTVWKQICAPVPGWILRSIEQQ
jgi:hypothetical protein